MNRVLIVEDDTILIRAVTNWLIKAGIASDSTTTIREGLARLKATDYDLVLCDLRLPDGIGIRILDWLNAENRYIPFIIMTKYGDVPTAVEAVKKGAVEYIEKPVHDIPLVEAIQKALQNAAPKHGGQVIYKRESPAYMKLMRRVELVATTDATVLIQGESGAGKEHIAEQLHDMSFRKGKPFVTRDCATIQKDLALSILFGHVKGSFTGAMENATGLIHEAEGGTLFLDEVENLPMDVQVMLLRVLEERKYQPLGSHKEIPCNIRLVAATNKDLRRMVNEGTFRNDLLARINEFPVTVPPLRYSREDILPLAEEFLKFFADKYHRSITGYTREARKKIDNYDWPENVRQLKHTIERAVILTPSGEVDADAVELEEIIVTSSLSLKNEEEERQRIIKAIELTGTLEDAARELGITRQTLYEKRKKYGLK